MRQAAAAWTRGISDAASNSDQYHAGDAPGLNAVIRAVALSAMGRRWEVISEGACETGSAETYKLEKDPFKDHAVLGGDAEQLARSIQAATGYEARSVVLATVPKPQSSLARDTGIVVR